MTRGVREGRGGARRGKGRAWCRRGVKELAGVDEGREAWVKEGATQGG